MEMTGLVFIKYIVEKDIELFMGLKALNILMIIFTSVYFIRTKKNPKIQN